MCVERDEAVKSTFKGDNGARSPGSADARASRESLAGAGRQPALASLCWRPATPVKRRRLAGPAARYSSSPS